MAAKLAKEPAILTVADVLAQPIKPYELESATHLTGQEAGHLQDFISEPADSHETFLQDVGGVQICESLVKILDRWPVENDIRYVVTLIDELLIADKSRAQLFVQLARADLNPYDALLRILDRYPSNAFLIAKAAHALAYMLSAACQRAVVPDALRFMLWIMHTAQNAQSKALVPALAALKELLKCEPLHDVFVNYGVSNDASDEKYEASTAVSRNLVVLSGLLVTHAQNTQVLYEVGFCFWLLSFNEAMVAKMREAKVIRNLVGVIKSLLRVKVVRVALAALRNMLDRERCNEQMIDAGLPRLLPTISARLAQWEDEEVADDVKAIESSLSKDIKELSSFEMYEKEVMSGELQWSVVHTEKFWRENAQKFDKDNFKLVRALVSLLSLKEDPVTLAVACYDLGEFARFHQNGKKVIQKIDGKTRLMHRMSHQAPEVAKQALLAVQKLMVNNWEFLNKA